MKKILCMCLAFIFLLTAFSGCSIIQFGNESHNNTHKDTESEFDTQLQTLCDESNSEPENELQESPAEDFEYVILEDGTVSITKYIGGKYDVILPSSIDNKAITDIGPNSFSYTDIRTISLPNSIITIQHNAFNKCENLYQVNLSQNLILIGDYAFSECTMLSEITLPESLTSLGSYCFYKCSSLKHITIPSNAINEKNGRVFLDSGLETIILSEGIKVIPADFFSNTNVKEIVLPSTIEEIGSGVFKNCKSLNKIELNKGLVKIGVNSFAYTNIKEIIIPNTVEQVYETSFYNCISLEKVKFEGNAPTNYIYVYFDPYPGAGDAKYTIYYHQDAEGFTTPEWNGYPTEIW